MKREIIIRKSSSVCKMLAQETIAGNINWVRGCDFQDCLDVLGLSIGGVNWLHAYLKYLQMIRCIPAFEKLYFLLYEERIFSISQSEYSRMVRLDFTSDFSTKCVWREIIAPQTQLIQLLNIIDAVGVHDSNENCKELLYSTGCIHA